jgi:genome maintenance exonuclease 1
MKKNAKYSYVSGTRATDHGSRTYDIAGEKLPSVTTILGKTKDRKKLDEWVAKVGFEESERIKNYSSKRGTSMHKFVEAYVLQKGYEDLTDIGLEAKPMAQKIIEVGLSPVSEWYGSEVTLFYPGLYAGATDLVCMHDDMETIVDYKQANKPKRREWIDDYFLQVAAYAMAHDHVYGSNIRQAVIMVCTPDLYYHEFKIQDEELRQWKHRFLVRLNMFYKMRLN